jgi:hypothetical protein
VPISRPSITTPPAHQVVAAWQRGWRVYVGTWPPEKPLTHGLTPNGMRDVATVDMDGELPITNGELERGGVQRSTSAGSSVKAIPVPQRIARRHDTSHQNRCTAI